MHKDAVRANCIEGSGNCSGGMVSRSVDVSPGTVRHGEPQDAGTRKRYRAGDYLTLIVELWVGIVRKGNLAAGRPADVITPFSNTAETVSVMDVRKPRPVSSAMKVRMPQARDSAQRGTAGGGT